ncbi:MAG: chemotaxis protein CheW [Spirochaetes bacterium]|nr:chemotaxis protein CheW [Spirochaetota bacterium]
MGNETLNSVNGKKNAEDVIQFLTFLLVNDTYGIEVEYVKEVNGYEKVFPVPRVSEYLKGVINLRGEIVPVIDLCSLLLGHSITVTKFTSIIILELQNEDEMIKIGVVIDAVKEVKNMPAESIEQTPGFGLKINRDFVKGVGKADDNFIILLDVSGILNFTLNEHLEDGKRNYSMINENGVMV